MIYLKPTAEHAVSIADKLTTIADDLELVILAMQAFENPHDYVDTEHIAELRDIAQQWFDYGQRMMREGEIE